MRFFYDAPIKRKQMLIILLAAGVALAMACITFVCYEIFTFRKGLVRNTGTLAAIIANNTAAALDFDDTKAAGETLSALKAEPQILAACLYKKTGKPFAVYSRSDRPARFEPPPVLWGGHEFKGDHLALFLPVTSEGTFVGVIYLESDLGPLYERIIRYVAMMAGIFVLTLLAALALSARLSRLVSEPLLELVQTTHDVARGKNYSLRAVKWHRDELGMLTDGFNEMLSQIQERDMALQAAQNELEHRVRERTQALANSLALVQATLESTTDGILVTDAAGDITQFNEQLTRMWNIPAKTAGTNDRAAFHEQALPLLKNSEAFVQPIQDAQFSPESDTFDLIEMKDGRILERSSKPHRIGDKCVGRVWSFRDVTERRRHEIEVAYERQLLRSLMDGSSDYIYFKDLSSRFLRCSRALCEQFKSSHGGVVGKTDADFLDPQYAQESLADEQQIIRTGDPIIGKVEKQGGGDTPEFWSLTSKMPLRNRGGQIIGTFGISKDITAFKQAEAKLQTVHKQLLQASRMAGMAEVATSVLHNVGNVLNSVNISCAVVSEKIKQSKAGGLAKAVALMESNSRDLPGFFANDPKGKQLPVYLGNLAEHLISEQKEMLVELASLSANIEHIKEIVSMQQNYAKVSGVAEPVKVADLVEDAVRMNAGAMERHQVNIVRDFEPVPDVVVDKHKVLQILVNLMRNAKYALDDARPREKRMTLRVRGAGEKRVAITVLDNGIGIAPENLTRIFAHGFTTRKDGHGFGLHSGALAARELGGSLTVHSDGHGKGAAFTLEIPSDLERIAA